MEVTEPITWSASGGVRILDQTLLPVDERYLDLHTVEDIAEAIVSLRVRGAPLIGIAAAMGVCLAAPEAGTAAGRKDLQDAVERACRTLAATRPTAVNLAWALERMRRRALAATDGARELAAALRAEADAIREEDRAMCRRIGEAGVGLLRDGDTVVTQCNAGILATGGIGTALAPVYLARERGWKVTVVAPETRPLLQGSRLTAWELSRAGVDCTLITDGMVASRLRAGGIRCAFVGADRIAANGDVANKIGTYGLALAAREHGVPFYVAAPRSTIDPAVPAGDRIPIEHRSADEVRGFRGTASAPPGIGTWNPAFDVTPAALITGIITDRGVFPPGEVLRALEG